MDLFEDLPPAPEISPTHLVFVYGSLKRGYHNHHLLMHSRFIGTGRTPPRFDLLDLGSFPAAIAGKHQMTGEVFEIDNETLKDLDRLEGNGFMYLRKQIPVVVAGRQIVVWCYLYLEDDGMDPLVEPVGSVVTWPPPHGWEDDDEEEDDWSPPASDNDMHRDVANIHVQRK